MQKNKATKQLFFSQIGHDLAGKYFEGIFWCSGKLQVRTKMLERKHILIHRQTDKTYGQMDRQTRQTDRHTLIEHTLMKSNCRKSNRPDPGFLQVTKKVHLLYFNKALLQGINVIKRKLMALRTIKKPSQFMQN